MVVRTRFAPSPTGFLHIGGVRTALYSWLYAKQSGGKFILRIEDTDQERSTQASTQVILDGMAWLGLDCDEGPFYQMQRQEIYAQYVQQLFESEHAYRCNCSKERLDSLREQQMVNKEKPRYDGHCRNKSVSEDEPHVVRFKNPVEGYASFHDHVYGDISVANAELDDLVIVKSDGVPTYNFAVVVDDWQMEISHVIRGDDHINNTPRQVNMLKALGAPIPEYAHLPMILGKDGKRLSKRHGAVNVLQYKDDGYSPDAVLNYLARLGWSHGDQEIFSRDELIKHFSFKHVHRGGATYDEDKFKWVNQHYLRDTEAATLKKQLTILDPRFASVDESFVEALKSRVQVLTDYISRSVYMFESPEEYDDEAVKKFIDDAAKKRLEAVRDILSECDWQIDTIKQAIKGYVSDNKLKFPQVAQPIRIAVSGSTETPSIDVVVYALGREQTLRRIDKILHTSISENYLTDTSEKIEVPTEMISMDRILGKKE